MLSAAIDYIEGWPAVAWVAGTGAGILLSAGVLWLRARALRDEPAVLASYRTVEKPGSDRGSKARAMAVVLLAILVVSQLLYIGLYVELAQWLLGARERPRIVLGLLFWVLLITGTCAGGALYTGLKKSD